ncbi:MAG: MoxR family ATPase [Ruminococcus sp.]|nr:MoxR family ATPase [Ruminococcus sp.]
MNSKIEPLIRSISKVIVGKDKTITQVVVALLCNGHVLIEDVPGVGKTQLAAALAKSLDGAFNRIQLTPDIMPSDIVGFSMIDRQTGEMTYCQGAAMCNFLLADEINRASPKVQSSLLEVMEEFQISLDGVTRPLPRPFMVLATQNPVETYGTFHLPEAQMDRFFLRLSMGYPTAEEELEIISRTEHENPIKRITEAALAPEDILQLQEEVKKVRVEESVKRYILAIVNATRQTSAATLGVSPRGSIALYKASKACAFIYERDYVTPADVKMMIAPVLAHRIILSPAGKSQYGTAESLLEDIISQVSVPLE